MGDLSLRMKAVADLQAVTDWTTRIDAARVALTRFNDEVERSHKVGGGGTMPGVPGPAPSGGGTGGGGYETDPTVLIPRATPSAKPPPPPAAAPPGALPSATDTDEDAGTDIEPDRRQRARQRERQILDMHLSREGWDQRASSSSTRHNWGANVASAAAGFVIGGSIVGILTSSAEVFMRNDKILTQLRRNFRDAEGDVASFGRSYTYSIQEAAQAGRAMGAQLDLPSRSDASRMFGFARWSGLDPGEVASTVGRIQRLSGGGVNDTAMAGLMGVAKMLGMANGRLPEFLQQVTGMAEEQLGQRGRVDVSSLAGLALFPGMVFGGDDPRSQGMEAAGFMGRLNQGFSTPSTSTFLMRLMGYGKAGGPGYLDMRERLEAGATDPRNIADILKYVSKLGFGTTARFQALEGALPTLKVHELRALAELTGSSDRMDLMQKYLSSGDTEGLRSFLADNGGSNFAELGRGRASVGEVIGTKWESLQMQVGEPMAHALLSLREALEAGIKTFTNLTGVDWGDVSDGIKKGAKAIERIADDVEHFTRGGAGSTARKVQDLAVDRAADTVIDLVQTGQRYGRGLVDGDAAPEAGGGMK